MPTGRPARHRRGRRGPTEHSGRQPGGRARRYLWAALAVPVLTAAGFYLARDSGGTLAAGHAGTAGAPGPASALPAPGPCGTPAVAAGAPCAIGSVSLAKVPAASRGPAASRQPAPVRASRTAAQPASVAGAPAKRATPGPTASPAAAHPDTPADQVLVLINQARAQAGLPPLAFSTGLDRSASTHNLTMAGGCGLSHQCPGEPALSARETAAGVALTSAGENVGENPSTPDTMTAIAQAAVSLTQDMLNEQPPDNGHRLNILSSAFRHIGIAVDESSSGKIWLTQDFSN
jgi:uncharacterized protein YkwD